MKTVAIGNQKGGVGKSAISVHFAFFLAEKGYSVAFIDMDAQGNSSSALGSAVVADICAFDLFSPDPVNVAPPPGTITLFRGTDDLSRVDRVTDVSAVIASIKPRFNHLSEAGFDFCVIDTPPSLSNLLYTALAVADYILCPIELSRFSRDGIQKMVKTISSVKTKFNRNLSFLGMMANRVNSRSGLQMQELQGLQRTYPDYVLNAHLVTRASFSQALDEAVPVWELRSGSARVAAREMRVAMGFLLDLVNTATNTEEPR